MSKKILIGYTGSWAFGVKSFYQIEELKEKLRKNPKDRKARAELKRIEKKRENSGSPVYISKEKHKKLKEWEELEYCSNWL